LSPRSTGSLSERNAIEELSRLKLIFATQPINAANRVGRVLRDAHDGADTQVECPGGFGCREWPRAVAHVVRESVEAILEVVWLRLTSSPLSPRYQQASYVWRKML
jgi:hypothetical protein